nr:ATP-binding protein [Tianweitania aestuarii]
MPYNGATLQERRAQQQPDTRILGRIIACDGAQAVIAARADDADQASHWTVGRMISVNLGDIRTVGFVYEIATAAPTWETGAENAINVKIELVGEVRDTPAGPVFNRGITTYPHLGANAHRIRGRDLEALYDLGGRRAISVGTLSQDASIDVSVAIDDCLNRHFAVVGTSGVGKSTAVSLLVRKAVAARPDLRVLIFDPHNEFATAFPGQAHRIDLSSLDLPFWMFRLEELAEVLFRGRAPDTNEVDLLRELIPQAKQNYRAGAQAGLVRRSSDNGGITADTPIPYRIADITRQLDERLGMLDSKDMRPVLRSLRARIDAAVADPRYRFMFASHLIEDTLHRAIGSVFRVPHEGKPITCFSMAGMPSEVVNAVCSVLARLAFDLAEGSENKLKILVLCEEAHRYMPSDPALGFAPVRHALSRIAKEGRKYGCYLGVVTQRPGELDATILSQCSTIFAMRLANEHDKAIIRSAISDSSASTLSFLSSMGQREAIAFGEGVATTMRLTFEEQPARLLPGHHNGDDDDTGHSDDVDLARIIHRLRATQQPDQGTASETRSSEPLPSAAERMSAPADRDREPSLYLRRATDTRFGKL